MGTTANPATLERPCALVLQATPLTFCPCLLLSPIATVAQLALVPAVDVEGGTAERRNLEGPLERHGVTERKGRGQPT